MTMPQLRPSATAPHWPKVWYRDRSYVANLQMGNGTAFVVCIAPVSASHAFVGVVGHGAALLVQNWKLDAGYVAEKLDLLNGDAANLVDFLNVQFGLFTESQGRYLPTLVSAGDEPEVK